MKSLLLLFMLGMAQPHTATIHPAPTAMHDHLRRKKNKDRPKLITYHRPQKVFAPIQIGRENIWTAFALGLVLVGYAGQLLYSRRGDSQFMAIVLATALLLEIIIILCHPIIWLIRWIKLLHWQRAWRMRNRLCPGQ